MVYDNSLQHLYKNISLLPCYTIGFFAGKLALSKLEKTIGKWYTTMPKIMVDDNKQSENKPK